MTFTHITFALLAGPILLTAGQSGLHREGDHWVETTSGSEAVAEAEQIKIISTGNITLRGGSGSQVEYTINRKVRVHSESQAREALQDAGVSLTRQGRNIRLIVNDATGPVDLLVSVPRSLHGVVVGTEAGNIEISDLDGSVQAQTGAGNAHLTRVKGSVDVRTSGGNMRLGDIGSWVRATSAGGEITADSIGGEARLETGGGDITVLKAGANIRAETAAGKVRIAEAAGAVIASTAGGLIDIGHVGGTVSAHNAGGGPILIGSAGGVVRCDNMSGAIKVGSLDGATRLVTASGSVIAQLHGSKLLGDSYIATGSGDITVYIPSNLSVTISAQNDGASRAQSIVSDFSGLQIRFDGGTATARGDLNGGGAVLRIQDNSGTIWIKKK